MCIVILSNNIHSLTPTRSVKFNIENYTSKEMSREQPIQVTLGTLPSNIAQFVGMFVDHLIERLILLICTVLTILGKSHVT